MQPSFGNAFQSPPRMSLASNDPAQQPRGLSELRIWKSDHAPAVCCSAWFGAPLVRRDQPRDAVHRPAGSIPYQVCICRKCSTGSLLPDLLREPNENSFGAPDVAEPIRILVLDHFADELRAAFHEPGERIVDVLHSEHDA